MTANASRDVSARPSILTPVANKLSEALLPILQCAGIKSIELKRVSAANLVKIVSGVSCFDGIPEDMAAYAMAIKDALAALMASVGIARLEITAEPEELKMLKEGYEQLDAMYKAARISSAEAEAESEAQEAPEAPEASKTPASKKKTCAKGCSRKKK